MVQVVQQGPEVVCRWVLPTLPSFVHEVIAAYYQGQKTYVPFQVSGVGQPVYVVCLDWDEQGGYQLAYHWDACTGGPVACATWREAKQVCRRLNGKP